MAATTELDAVKSMNRATKADILKDSDFMLELGRQARGRLLGDWSDRTAAPKRAEVAELPKVKRVPAPREVPLSPHGEMAAGKLLTDARERAKVESYGWQASLARLADVSVSVLKRLRADLPVSVKICEKVAAVPMAEIEAEVAKLLAERRAA